MAFTGILLRKPPRCHINVGFFTLIVILVIFFAIVNYNSSSHSLEIGKSTLKYNCLQPLRDMFANVSKVKGRRSNMLNVSDLQEVQNKESVLLLLIVTTSPSRYERREAIRQTWWKKCDGTEVS